MTILLEQEKVNELVDRFYVKLLQDPYYVSMFKERNVDIEVLKNRQRDFISRLVSEESALEQGNHISQVQERHSFQIAPDRALIWYTKLKETVDEIELDGSTKERLLQKVEFLLKKII